MQGSTRVAVRSLLAIAAILALADGCSQQGEGARCDAAAGLSGTESDCADGLVCTDPTLLEYPKTSLCCPSDGTFTSVGCTPKGSSAPTSSATATNTAASTASGTGGAGGVGGNGGDDGTGGTGAGTGGTGGGN
ncbi:MAG: hypothetical protein EXR75_14275 [Myxococcales bacterium]|nr:hypothetical protein [Myxococcales bacterium]